MKSSAELLKGRGAGKKTGDRITLLHVLLWAVTAAFTPAAFQE